MYLARAPIRPGLYIQAFLWRSCVARIYLVSTVMRVGLGIYLLPLRVDGPESADETMPECTIAISCQRLYRRAWKRIPGLPTWRVRLCGGPSDLYVYKWAVCPLNLSSLSLQQRTIELCSSVSVSLLRPFFSFSHSLFTASLTHRHSFTAVTKSS